MIVTVFLVVMPGPKQLAEVKLRIDTDDFVDAVAQAVEQVKTITTVAIEKIHVSR